MAKNSKNNQSGNPGDQIARGPQLPSGDDKTAKSISSSMNKFSSKLGIIQKDEEIYHDNILKQMGVFSSAISELTKDITDAIDNVNDQMTDVNFALTSLINIDNKLDTLFEWFNKDKFGKPLTQASSYVEAIVKNFENPISKFFTNLDTVLDNRLINIESGVYAIAAAFWGWDKVKKNKEVTDNLKVGTDALFANFADLNKKLSKYLDDMETAMSGSSDDSGDKSQSSGPAMPMFDPLTTVFQVDIANTNKDFLKNVISCGVNDSTKLNDILSVLKDIKSNGSSTSSTPSASDNKAGGPSDDMSGIVIDDKKSAENALQDTLDVLAKLKEVAASPDSKLLITGKGDIEKLKEAISVYVDLIHDMSDSLTTLAGPIANSNKTLKNDNTSPIDLIHKLVDGFSSLDYKKLDIKKIKKTISKVRPLFSPKGPLANLLADISDFEGMDTKKIAQITNSINAIIGIPGQFADEHFDDMEEGVHNGIKLIGDEKHLKNTFFGLNVKIKALAGDINKMTQSLLQIKNTKSVETVNSIFSLYGNIGEVLDEIDIDDITDDIECIIGEGGLNSYIVGLVQNLENTFIEGGLEKKDLDLINETFVGLGEVVSQYNNLDDKLKMSTIFKLMLKFSLLTDVNGVLIQQMREMQRVNIKAKSADKFVDSVQRIMGAVDALKELGGSMSIKDSLTMSTKMEGIGTAIKQVKAMYKDFSKAFKNMKEEELQAMVAKNGKMELVAKLVKTLADITHGFEKISLGAHLGAKGVSKCVAIIKGVKEIVDILGDKEFGEKLKFVVDNKTGIIHQIANLSKLLVRISLYGIMLIVPSVLGALGFKMARMTTNQIEKIIDTFADLDSEKIKTVFDNLKSVKKIIENLADIFMAGTMMGVFAMPALVGFKLTMFAFKKGLKKLIMQVVGWFKNEKDYEKVQKTTSQLAQIVKSFAIIMSCGAVCGLLAIPAMVGFFTMIPALMTLKLVLKVIGNLGGGRAGKKNRTNVRDMAKLIMYMGGIMLIGGLIGGIVGKMMPNIIMFAMALGMFIFMVVGALNIALLGGGVRHLEKSAKGIMQIVIMSSIILLFGGMIMMLQPKMILYSLAWAIILGAFIFGLVFTIKMGARAMKRAKDSLVWIMAFLIVIATVLLLPAAILTANPKMTLYLLAWTAILAGFMIGMRFAMATIPGKRKIMKAASNIWAIAGLSLALAASVWIIVDASNRIKDWEKLGVAVASMFGILVAVAVGAILLTKFKNLISKKALATMAALEALCLGLAITMTVLALAVNVIKDTTTFNARVWSMIGIIAGIGVLAALLGSMFTQVALGVVAIAGVEALVIGIGVCMSLLAVSLGLIADVSKKKVNMKNLIELVGATIGLAIAMAPLANPALALLIMTASAAVGTLGMAISNIAKGVAEGAGMHYTKYENGKKVGEFNLTPEDFTKAAQNTKEIVSVLGGAILDIYDENPEIFNTGTLLGDLIGTKTKFEKVVGSVSRLGKAISLIAKGVAKAANQHYTKYENGKKVGEFNLTTSDYKNAANNTKLVIRTLGRAVMQAYDENPDIFTATGSSNGMVATTLNAIGDFFGMGTKFSRVVKSVGALGNLISSIASGVSNMANMVITSYDKDGKEHKRNANLADFALAAANTNFIITFLGDTIIKAYESHPDLFTSGSQAGDMLGFNPKFKNIVDTISALGTMMSNIAGGVQAFANNQVPVYGAGGKILTYKKIEPDDYIKAGETITELITTMGDSIMNVYNMHPDWFSSKWYNLSKTSDNNMFTDVVKSLTGMSNLISAYAKAIQEYASGNITIYGPDGKEMGKIPITEDTYHSAANAVSTCISILSESVYETWNKHKDDIFDEDNFEPLMDNLERMSKLISKYSDSVKDFSNLYYDVYDDTGKKIGKKRVTEDDFTKAGETISTMITTMATGVKKAYETSPALFQDTNADPNKKSSGKTWFEQIINSFWSVSPLISRMSDAVVHYATLRVPLYDANGKPTGGTRALTQQDFTDAGSNISTIMTKMVESVWGIYQNERYKEMFQNASKWNGEDKDDSNPFYVMSTALGQTGIMVQNCAKATQDVINIKGFENPEKVSKLLNTRVGVITTAMIKAVDNAYNTAPDLFDDALSKDSVFLKVQTAIHSAYELFMEGMKVYQEATKLDLATITKLTGGEDKDVSANQMYKMINGLSAPIVGIYSGVVQLENGSVFPLRELFDSVGQQKSMFTKIVEAVKSVANIMNTVGGAYQDISEMDFNVNEISGTISIMLKGLVTPIGDAYTANKGAFDDVCSVNSVVGTIVKNIGPQGVVRAIGSFFGGEDKGPADTPAQRVVQAIGAVAGIMNVVVKAYEGVANMKIPGIKTTTGRMHSAIVSLAHTVANVGNNEYVKDLDGNCDDILSGFDKVAQLMFGMPQYAYQNGAQIPVNNGERGVIGIYNALGKLRIGSQKEAMSIGAKLEILITAIPKIFGRINANQAWIDGLEKADDIADHMEDCQEAVSSVSGLYTTTVTMINNLAKKAGKPATEAVDYMGTTISTMFEKLGSALTIENMGVIGSKDIMNDLKISTWLFAGAMNNLISVYNRIPTMNKDIEYFIPYMVKLQNELGNVPKLTEFTTEVNNLISFNNSINSLQAKNVQILTQLFIEFNKFASKFGNLDNFTKVLATKMATCLTYLADQIKESAKHIDKAEAIQKKRQEEIKKTIAEFKTLANMGLEVTVKSAEPETSEGGGSIGGAGGSDESSSQNNSTVESQSTGRGSTSGRNNVLGEISNNVRDIARTITKKYY